MEPRLESRGIPRARRTRRLDRSASMEPRLESRGIWRAPYSVVGGIEELQWSRGSKAAESTRSQRRTSLSMGFNGAAARKPRNQIQLGARSAFFEVLQWSRGSKAAESCRRGRKRYLGRCSFNGAAARKPRNPRQSPPCQTPPCQLQWSRGSKAAESGSPHSGGAVRLAASMEPRLESRGISMAA